MCSNCSVNSCRLDDGIYRVVYEQEFGSFEYEVKSDTITQIYQDNSVTSIIDWISENEYYLNDLPTAITHQQLEENELIEQLNSTGKPFYRLKSCRNDTIYFELMRNQHITIYTGKLVKIK